ncbi:MAG TPA: peptidoglycan DD-metalloendopeptidase family protein [Gammaproteobacteria bacterium]|nr:peptidoglycan DD-metalloendopeptidase family protein [Gammaproteobacteria bacterium]
MAAVFAIAALMAAAAAGADDSAAAKKHELAQLRARIAAVKRALDAEVGRRHDATAALREAEDAVGEAQAALHAVAQKTATAEKQLATLKAEQAHQQQALDRQKSALATQIRAAYMAGRDSRLKLMLNQQDPAAVERMLTYYDYFNRARSARIAQFNAGLQKLAALGHQIKAQLAHLDTLQQQRAADLATLKRRRTERAATLKEMNASIAAHQDKLQRMQRSEQALERLIRSLARTLADIPAALDSTPFSKLAGKLAWPVAGPHIAAYDSLRADGRLRWDGVLIGGKLGEAVHAIAHGRVVYAGWLPHFGLLMIIDHGGGYMSLYAHNQSLYKQVGDWVNAGDIVAALGDSGGQQRPALYFEIRHGKDPVNPGHWCKR